MPSRVECSVTFTVGVFSYDIVSETDLHKTIWRISAYGSGVCLHVSFLALTEAGNCSRWTTDASISSGGARGLPLLLNRA